MLLSARALAQTGPPGLEFSFSNPGARSMGLGGAFSALADDATAAFANPAGLVQLSRPEVSLEGRRWSYATPFTLGGRLSGQPTGIMLDNTSGLRSGVSSDVLSGLSFLSFVYPADDWSFAAYRHQLASFSVSSETQGFFGTQPSGESFRFRDIRASTRLDVVTIGVSAAYRLSDALSLGIGLSYFDGEFDLQAEASLPIDETLPDGLFGPNAYSPSASLETQRITTIDVSDWGLTGGFLWQVDRSWSVGGFYRQGPRIMLEAAVRAGPAAAPIPEGTLIESESGTSPIELPDTFGLGLAYRSRDGTITASFDWDRVQYSSIIESLSETFADTEGTILNDGDEFRFGFEYAFVRLKPVIAVRAGAWLDPNHRVLVRADDALSRAIFRGGDDEGHLALGVGIAFPHFQIDVGIDLSKLVDTASVSGILSF